MNKHQRLFFLATLDSLETAVASQLKALRSLIALDVNDSQGELVEVPARKETIQELEEAFEKSIFSITADQK